MPKHHALLAALVALALPCLAGEIPPPDAPAAVSLEGNRLVMFYSGDTIFSATIRPESGRWFSRRSQEVRDSVVTQVISLTSKEGEPACEVEGDIVGSDESIPCEVDRRPRGLDVVRNSYGLSTSLANRAVYDRRLDWVLSVDYYAAVTIRPLASDGRSNRFHLKARGREIILRFQPRYYQRHRGLKYFQPWTYSVWKKPVVGWCSWFAYHDSITESIINDAAAVVATVLKPFGYEYLQIDDGYQRGEGMPDQWLSPNAKFPGGLGNLSRTISEKGLAPGIWTNVAFHQREIAERHKDWFVLDDSGRPAEGNWIDLSIEGTNREMLDSVVRPVYASLRRMGWKYFKVDALRHLRYEGYNSNNGYFRKRGIDPVGAYRAVAQTIREEIGRDRYMLGCWGIRPELVGIIDGCRLGDDGFSFAGMCQYNSFNNIVWRNDPDHVELSEAEAYRSTMVTSLTGSVLMLTDKPEKYESPLVEPARRAAPVLFTLPGQLFDVDPSRSGALGRVNTEVSGSGPRPFDAGYAPRCQLYTLEINKPYEQWLMLGRMGGGIGTIPFGDLGLAPDSAYLVFEFWSKKFLGAFKREFSPGEIDSRFHCQLFCIRGLKQTPQLLATNRHISCGGLDVDNLEWRNDTLAGESMLVAGDPYDIYIHQPSGWIFRGVQCKGADVLSTESTGEMCICHLVSKKGGRASWHAVFQKRPE